MSGASPTIAENEALAARCEALAAAAGEAIGWIGEAGARLGEEGPMMARDFRREALRARRLAAAARRPMCVSVFGPSQQGKSYLIASLARKDGAPTAIRFADRQLGFNRDINPDGGKESTGLVTRFSIRQIEGLQGKPVACRLLSETDIVKILANAFMEDFDRDTVVPLPRAEIDAALDRARGRAAAQPVDALGEDDVYDLFSYCERYFKNHPCHATLGRATWQEIEHLAPRLPIAERMALFALLWNRTPSMTATGVLLVEALARLGFADEAFCPLAAITPKARSIIDVETMRGLGRDNGDAIDVATRAGRAAAVPRAVLTAITAELRLELAERPFDFFDHTDLLDFPGARAREKYSAERAEATAAENLFMLFRRGKVAYLYQRYLAEQELTAMLLCLRDSNQEVRSVPGMVRDWIDATHGSTAEARAGRATALFLVLTMFDREFATKAGASSETVEHWSIRFDTTIKQYLGLDHDWPGNWTPGAPFSHTYWLRNPEVHDRGLLDYDPEMRELRFRDPERLARLRANYLRNPDVQAHVARPDEAWDAAMALNDGGVGRIARDLAPVCNPALKRTQVAAQLAGLGARLARQIERYHVSGDLDAELARRRAEARLAGRALLACAEAQAFGLMLRALQVNAEMLAEAFRRRLLDVAEGEAAGLAPIGARVAGGDLAREFDALFDDDAPSPAPAPATDSDAPQDMADLLAAVALGEWVDTLHRFAARADLQALFRLPPDAATFLTGQLAQAGRRIGLRARIAAAIRAGTGPHERLAERLIRPVLVAERALNDFVAWLGWAGQEESARPRAGRDQHPVFARPPAAEDIPTLSETPLAYDATYYLDWVTAFVRLVEDNVRDASGAGIDLAANARLGRILAALRAPS
jgi:hypothetical protein